MVTANKNEQIYSFFCYLIVGLAALVALVPLLYVFSMSLTGEREWIDRGGFIFIPFHPTFRAYEIIFTAGSAFVRSLFISIERTILGTAIQLSLTVITGYIMSRIRLPGRKFIIIMVLVTILFGSGLIPTYLVIRSLGIMNTIWALIIPGAVHSWSALVFKQFFEGIPASLEESAEMDGATEFTKMVKILLPMSAPSLAAIGLFTAVGHWNAWFDVMLYINDGKLYTMQYIIRNMFVSSNLSNDLILNYGLMDVDYRVPLNTLRMAVAIFGTVPILLVYPFLQKYFIRGVYLGAVKE
ncbi:MAG: carbohydrate ABC transporter permease [Treponema sp.]|nr:carbohydrate ABC transporter permease [Treponema sp.]